MYSGHNMREAKKLKSIKPIIVLVSIVTIITIMIPAVLVLSFSKDHADGTLTDKLLTTKNPTVDVSKLEQSSIEVAVLRSGSNKVEKLPLEKYIVGVVSGEMPAKFELEALKAQALTARTYIINQMLKGPSEGLNGANVTDTVDYQVYKSEQELKKQWGADYDKNLNKINKAVLETEGQIVTYKGEPIMTQYFSTSNGYTENSEDYWENAYPYLKSVASPWDKTSPEFFDHIRIPVSEFEQKLGVKLKNTSNVGTVVKRTSGNRVATVNINGKIITGRQIREQLNLKSSDFDWKRKGDVIEISTKGYGHGVGMSQYGANGMAKEGKSYKQIVQHYYQGIEIITADQLTEKIVAKK